MVLLTPFGAEAVLAEDFARRHAGHPVRRLAVAPDAYVSETGYALVGATGAVERYIRRIRDPLPAAPR